MISEERLFAGIRESTARLAGIVIDEAESRPIPTCPEWTLRQLATHVGRSQRWAAEIVIRRSPEFIAYRDVPDGRLPDDPAARPDWLNAGASLLIDAVREGGSEKVWTHSGIRPAGCRTRRRSTWPTRNSRSGGTSCSPPTWPRTGSTSGSRWPPTSRCWATGRPCTCTPPTTG